MKLGGEGRGGDRSTHSSGRRWASASICARVPGFTRDLMSAHVWRFISALPSSARAGSRRIGRRQPGCSRRTSGCSRSCPGVCAGGDDPIRESPRRTGKAAPARARPERSMTLPTSTCSSSFRSRNHPANSSVSQPARPEPHMPRNELCVRCHILGALGHEVIVRPDGGRGQKLSLEPPSGLDVPSGGRRSRS